MNHPPQSVGLRLDLLPFLLIMLALTVNCCFSLRKDVTTTNAEFSHLKRVMKLKRSEKQSRDFRDLGVSRSSKRNFMPVHPSMANYGASPNSGPMTNYPSPWPGMGNLPPKSPMTMGNAGKAGNWPPASSFQPQPARQQAQQYHPGYSKDVSYQPYHHQKPPPAAQSLYGYEPTDSASRCRPTLIQLLQQQFFLDPQLHQQQQQQQMYGPNYIDAFRQLAPSAQQPSPDPWQSDQQHHRPQLQQHPARPHLLVSSPQTFQQQEPPRQFPPFPSTQQTGSPQRLQTTHYYPSNQLQPQLEPMPQHSVVSYPLPTYVSSGGASVFPQGVQYFYNQVPAHASSSFMYQQQQQQQRQQNHHQQQQQQQQRIPNVIYQPYVLSHNQFLYPQQTPSLSVPEKTDSVPPLHLNLQLPLNLCSAYSCQVK